MTDSTSTGWEQFLHREIPITRAMGIEVVRWDDAGLALRAPLRFNHNDKGTAFAGSMYSLAALAGWSTVMLLLVEAGLKGQAVIYDSRARFVQPVTEDYQAVCPRPDAQALGAFVAAYHDEGRAKLDLAVRVLAHDTEVAVFEGRYAAFAG